MKPRRRILSPLLSFFLFVAMVLSPASAMASIADATVKLLAQVAAIRLLFPNARDRSEWASGTLEPGQTATRIEHFDEGVEYVILAVGCDSAKDIDLGVIDGNGDALAIDEKPNAEPVVRFVPQYTGRYVVAVHMAKTTTGEAAHYAYQVFYRVREH